MAKYDLTYKIAQQPIEVLVLTSTPGDFVGTGIDLKDMRSFSVGMQLELPLVPADVVTYKFQISDDNGVGDPWADVPLRGTLPLWKTDYTLENPVSPYLQTAGFYGVDKRYIRVVLTVTTLTTPTDVTIIPIMESNSKNMGIWSATPPPNDDLP